MGKFLFLACLLLIPMTAASADEAEDKYQALLKIAQADPAKADWQALRFAYSETTAADVANDPEGEDRKAIYEAFDAGDYEKALAHAKAVIARAFVDLQAHRYAAVAYKHLNNPAGLDSEMRIARGLMASIMTGDGLSPKAAFTVISVNEEYELLHSLGLQVAKQALITTEGHSYDLMSTIDADGKAQEYYFLIDRVLAAEAKKLQPSP